MKLLKGKIDSVTFVLPTARSIWLIRFSEREAWMHSVALRMLWDAVGTLRAPKVNGAPFSGQQGAPEFLWSRWVITDTAESFKGNAALLVAEDAVHPAEVEGSSDSGVGQRWQQQKIWLSHWRGLVWWAAGEEALLHVNRRQKKQNKGITPFKTSRGVALPLGQNTGSQKAEWNLRIGNT